MQATVRRLRRKLGEDASLLIYFFTKERVCFRMDRAKRRNRKRHNRAARGRRGHHIPLSFLQPVRDTPKPMAPVVPNAPNHISKMVLSTVQLGPPNWTESRIFVLRFKLEA